MRQDNDRRAADKFLRAKAETHLRNKGWYETSKGWTLKGSTSSNVPFEDADKLQKLIDNWGAKVKLG